MNLSTRATLVLLHPITWLVGGSAALAVIYGAVGGALYDANVSTDLIALLKASSIIVLVATAALGRAPRLIVYALFAGAVGDALLAKNTEQSFLLGAGAFLVGHLLYIAGFLRMGVGRGGVLRQPLRIVGILAILAAAILMTSVLVPRDSPMYLPLNFYTGVLTLMTMTSFTLPASRCLAMLGAVLFFISDGFVAWNRFYPDPDPTLAFWRGFAGWMIYWAGQAGLCIGALELNTRATRAHG